MTRMAIVNRLSWTIGYAETLETLSRVYRLAWNSANNEPVVAVVAEETDRGDALARIEATEGLYPGGEERLIHAHSVIAS